MEKRGKQSTSSDSASSGKLSASAFRRLVDAFVNMRAHGGPGGRHQTEAERHLEEVRAMIERHTPDAARRELLHRAREAARGGEHESLLVRFPSSQCSDGGRAINISSAAWPTTLTGAAADAYGIWHHELEPRGFRITARILDYPHGNLGDAGLFLSWAADA